MRKHSVAFALFLLFAAVTTPQMALGNPSHSGDFRPNQNSNPESRVQETATSILAAEEGGIGGLVDGYAEAARNNQGYDAQLLFTDTNGKAAMALASLVEHTGSQFILVNESLRVNLDDKIKLAMNFIERAQTDAKNFRYAYDYVNNIWYEPPPYYNTDPTEFDWWNAYIVASLAFVAAKMHMSDALSERDKASYNGFKTIAETCIDAWRSRTQQSDGSWVFAYSYSDESGFHLRHDTAIDTSGMMLVALVALARLESSEGNSSKAYDYAQAAGMTASWLLARQELNPTNQWAYGGFYNSVGSQTLYLDANARAAIGLIYFALSTDTLALSRYATKEQLTQRLVLWADQFVTRTHDSWWGPYWKLDATGLTNDGYPKFTYSAAELGLALTGISVLLSDPKYHDISNNFYAWYTGNNEFGTDFQFVLPKPRMYTYVPTPRAFSLGIDFNSSRTLVVWPDSNLETNAETLQHMLALARPDVTWSLPEPTSSSQQQPQRCVIATAAYGSELAPPVQFLRDFRDKDVNGTYLGNRFLAAFNAWYYSWAPAVAKLETENADLRAAVRIIMLPLLAALFLSRGLFSFLTVVNPDVAILVAGLAASVVIGVSYVAPFTYIVARVTKRKRVSRTTFLSVAVLGVIAALSGTLPQGTIGIAQNLTSILVVETVLLGSVTSTHMMIAHPAISRSHSERRRTTKQDAS
jgi:hypothetical protein